MFNLGLLLSSYPPKGPRELIYIFTGYSLSEGEPSARKGNLNLVVLLSYYSLQPEGPRGIYIFLGSSQGGYTSVREARKMRSPTS